MPGTLHITNGDSVALKLTGLEGDILFWRDVLHEGPAPSGLTLDQLSALRAGFLAGLSSQAVSNIRADLFFSYMRGLTNGRVPLLRFVGDWGRSTHAQVAVTAEGRAVLRGEADYVRLNGINRWLGGVHLRDNEVWRWDDVGRNIVRE